MRLCSKRSMHSRRLSSLPLDVPTRRSSPRRAHCLSRHQLLHPGAPHQHRRSSRQTRTKTCLPRHPHASLQRRFGVAAAPHLVASRQCTPSRSPTSSPARPSSQCYRKTLTLRSTAIISTASALRHLAGLESLRSSTRLWTRIRLP
jgi:hypothetical protein